MSAIAPDLVCTDCQGNLAAIPTLKGSLIACHNCGHAWIFNYPAQSATEMDRGNDPVVTINGVQHEVEFDSCEELRFKGNRIVGLLLDFVTRGLRIDLNTIEQLWDGRMMFTREELCEFYRLIGFSVDGYCDLPCAALDKIECSLWDEERTSQASEESQEELP